MSVTFENNQFNIGKLNPGSESPSLIAPEDYEMLEILRAEIA